MVSFCMVQLDVRTIMCSSAMEIGAVILLYNIRVQCSPSEPLRYSHTEEPVPQPCYEMQLNLDRILALPRSTMVEEIMTD